VGLKYLGQLLKWKVLVTFVYKGETLSRPHQETPMDEPDMNLALVLLIVLAAAALWATYPTPKPSADDLYGCTPAHQAPNGECK
jgi:hypothetical protein